MILGCDSSYDVRIMVSIGIFQVNALYSLCWIYEFMVVDTPMFPLPSILLMPAVAIFNQFKFIRLVCEIQIQMEIDLESKLNQMEDIKDLSSNTDVLVPCCQLTSQAQFINGLISSNHSIFIVEQKPLQGTYGGAPLTTSSAISLEEKILNYNRKEKSLEELSRRFIDHFQGRENYVLELDKVTAHLGVERRRVYDIINILESLQVVSKNGKNNYLWKGLKEAIKTIQLCSDDTSNFKIQNVKKEKSLQFLASGFLKLFLHWRPAISLEEAAREMMKNIDESVIKTKIRRLYDIVNVFKSLGLVRKVLLEARKPGFQWIGTQKLQKIVQMKREALPVPQIAQERSECPPAAVPLTGASFLTTILLQSGTAMSIQNIINNFHTHLWPQEANIAPKFPCCQFTKQQKQNLTPSQYRRNNSAFSYLKKHDQLETTLNY